MTKIKIASKPVVLRSVCRLSWITKDGRLAFQYGKVYMHNQSEELSIKGEHGIVMWMTAENYHKHFEEANIS